LTANFSSAIFSKAAAEAGSAERDLMKKRPVFLMLLAISFLFSLPSEAYLPGAAEILAPLVRMAAGTETIRATGTVSLAGTDSNGDPPAVLQENTFMKSPHACRFETSTPGGIDVTIFDGRRSLAMVGQNQAIRDSLVSILPAILFLEKPLETLLNDLSFLGVHTDRVALERFGGKIAYVIGNNEDIYPGSRLWIDKATGRPLRFEGHIFRKGRPTSLRADFENYQDIRKGTAFPKEIVYFLDGLPAGRRIFTDISRNVPLPDGLFAVPSTGKSPYPALSGFLDART